MTPAAIYYSLTPPRALISSFRNRGNPAVVPGRKALDVSTHLPLLRNLQALTWSVSHKKVVTFSQTSQTCKVQPEIGVPGDRHTES